QREILLDLLLLGRALVPVPLPQAKDKERDEKQHVPHDRDEIERVWHDRAERREERCVDEREEQDRRDGDRVRQGFDLLPAFELGLLLVLAPLLEQDQQERDSYREER